MSQRLKQPKLIPVLLGHPLYFCLALNVFSDIGLVGRIEKKNLKTKSHEVLE